MVQDSKNPVAVVALGDDEEEVGRGRAAREVRRKTGKAWNQWEARMGRRLKGMMTSWTSSAWHMAPAISGRVWRDGSKRSG